MRRTLHFADYDAVTADAEALLATGYERVGSWRLGQVCSHLAKAVEKSLDGYPKVLPAPLRLLARWFALGKILSRQPQNRRFPTAPYLVPADAEADEAGLDALRAALGRLKGHAGELHPHPVFGKLTPAQWKDLHLWHCEHHLSFLLPRAKA